MKKPISSRSNPATSRDALAEVERHNGLRQNDKKSLGFIPVFVPAAVLALLMAGGGVWWMCGRSEAIPFLPARTGAEWIVVSGRANLTVHQGLPVTAVFRHSFTLTTPPAKATLTACAFKGAAVAINGRAVENLPVPGQNWKSPSSAEVAGLLQPGTNEITAWVTNATGPPALWLRLQSAELSLGTSEHWQASLPGLERQNARCARQPPEFHQESSLYGNTGTRDLLKRAWPLEAVFIMVSLALVLATNRRLRRRHPPGDTLPTKTSTRLIYGLLAVVLLARAALFINDLPQLTRGTGFDAKSHELYIQFIQEKHALPLADDGWEMYQPPLYYLASALVLDGCGRAAASEDAVFIMRMFNGVIGLLHCWLVLLCLRLLFWENIQAQAAGLLVAAFLPPHLYLSQYVTNEPLAGFWITVAIYFFLRTLRTEKGSPWLAIGTGLALGAAMLTKFSALLALPFFPAALILRAAARKELMRRDWLRNAGRVAAGCLIICGWHYGRVWARFGTPIVGNWDSQIGLTWWQDPGFRTSAYYSRFGQALISPSFSAFHSFADGIYSTLWGDGLGSGMADPSSQAPWNYDLMGVGYWLSLGLSLLLIIGAGLTLARLIRQFSAEWFLVLGMVCLFGLGLFWMTLRVPYYSVVKAFFAFPVLLPFSALVAAGWDWLRQRHRAAGVAAWVLLLVWAMTVYASYWIRSGNPATHFVRGIHLANQKNHSEAGKSFSAALKLKPGFPEAHYQLGTALLHQGQTEEAIREFQEAIRLNPDDAEFHNDLGTTLGIKGQTDEAIRQFREAVRLQPDYAEAHCNLGTALFKKGQVDEAIGQYEKAIQLRPNYDAARENLANILEWRRQARARTSDSVKP